MTSLFDVIKTRLQSDLFRHKHAQAAVGVMGGNSSTVVMDALHTTGLLYNFVKTGRMFSQTHNLKFSTVPCPYSPFFSGTFTEKTQKNHHELYSKA